VPRGAKCGLDVTRDFRSAVVFGKFWPLHVGHAALIGRAVQESESVLVAVDDGAEDVPTHVRMNWVRELFPEVEVTSAPDLCGHDTIDCTRECSRAYANWLRANHAEVDAVFAGDSYGDVLASELGARSVHVDRIAKGRDVRANLPGLWDQLTPPARGWYCRRVVVIGAESTGTTTLANDLALHFHTEWVPEYGREFTEVHGLDHAWTRADFAHIARRQGELEDQATRRSNRLLICDTDVLATSVWFERYMGSGANPVTELAQRRRPTVYLLTSDDIPFVQDGLRDGERIRSWMTERFRQELTASRVPWRELTGSRRQRLNESLAFLGGELGRRWVTR
jgi:HTH-type transcriptional repressor of NAD biosynthesis genes